MIIQNSSRTLMAQKLKNCLPWLTRTHSWVPMVPFMSLLWSNFCIYIFMLLLSFSIFSGQGSLKIANENKNTKTLTLEASYIVLGSLDCCCCIVVLRPR